MNKYILNNLSLWTWILRVKSSEVHYYLELKSKEDRVIERQKGKDSMKITKMFIHIEYSLQVEVHCYYNGVQDTTLQIDTRVVFILRLLRLQELSTSRSGRPAKRDLMKLNPPRAFTMVPTGISHQTRRR